MKSYLDQYEAKAEGVTLHTWTEVEGAKQENFYVTGKSGAPIPEWFREVVHQKHLADITDFPYAPSRFYD